MNYKDIISNLPSKWEDINLHQFKKLLDLKVSESEDEIDGLFNGVDNTIKVLSVLSGISIELLESCPFPIIQEMANKIGFTLNEPDPKKCATTLKIKNLESITYDNYVTFITLANEPLKNITQIIKSFSAVELSDEEIEKLSVTEVMGAFFLLTQKLRKYIRCSTKQAVMKLLKQAIREFLTQVSKLKFWNKKD